MVFIRQVWTYEAPNALWLFDSKDLSSVNVQIRDLTNKTELWSGTIPFSALQLPSQPLTPWIVSFLFNTIVQRGFAPAQYLPPAAVVTPKGAFGPQEWGTCYGDVGRAPPLPANIGEILKSKCPYWPDRTVEETHSLVLIPQIVGGNPLTLNLLGELMQHPKQGPAMQYRPNGYFPRGHEKTAAPPSHWALMTKDVVPESRGKSYADQCKQLRPPYKPPTLLEAVVGVMAHYVMTGNRLLSDSPQTYTRCEEAYTEWQMVVGVFGDSGLYVVSYHGDLDFVGLLGLRKF